MKKFLSLLLVLALSVTMLIGFTSCKDKDTAWSLYSAAMKKMEAGCSMQVKVTSGMSGSSTTTTMGLKMAGQTAMEISNEAMNMTYVNNVMYMLIDLGEAGAALGMKEMKIKVPVTLEEFLGEADLSQTSAPDLPEEAFENVELVVDGNKATFSSSFSKEYFKELLDSAAAELGGEVGTGEEASAPVMSDVTLSATFENGDLVNLKMEYTLTVFGMETSFAMEMEITSYEVPVITAPADADQYEEIPSLDDFGSIGM